jgi:hypothetical protein
MAGSEIFTGLVDAQGNPLVLTRVQLVTAAGAAAGNTVDTELPAAVAAADNLANPTAPQVLAHLVGWNTSSWERLRTAGGSFGVGRLLVTTLGGFAQGDASTVLGGVDSSGNGGNPAAGNLLYNGASWDMQRTPSVFKVVALAAGTAETTIWTPAAGKKFRLMGFILTCGAASTLTFKDGTGLATIFAARGGLDVPIPVPNLGNGILSGAANRVLTVTRGTSATLDGVVWGTEE